MDASKIIEAFVDADAYSELCKASPTSLRGWKAKPIDKALARYVEQSPALHVHSLHQPAWFDRLPEEVLATILTFVATNATVEDSLDSRVEDDESQYGKTMLPMISRHLFKARTVCRRFALIGGHVFERLVTQKGSPYHHYRQIILSGRPSPLLIGDTLTASSINLRDLINGIRVPLTVTFKSGTTLFEFLTIYARLCFNDDMARMDRRHQRIAAEEYGEIFPAHQQQHECLKLIDGTAYLSEIQALLRSCVNASSLAIDCFAQPSTWEVAANYDEFQHGCPPAVSEVDALIFNTLLQVFSTGAVKHLSVPFFALRLAKFDEVCLMPLIRNLASLTFEADSLGYELAPIWCELPSHCKSLTTLTLKLAEDEWDSPGECPHLEDFITDVCWPVLQNVNFENLQSSSACLHEFVATHCSTLRNLRLFMHTLDWDESWGDTLIALKGLPLQLDSCNIVIRHYSDDPSARFLQGISYVNKVEYGISGWGDYCDYGSYLLEDGNGAHPLSPGHQSMPR